MYFVAGVIVVTLLCIGLVAALIGIVAAAELIHKFNRGEDFSMESMEVSVLSVITGLSSLAALYFGGWISV